MHELQQLLSAIEAAQQEGKRAALATVVRVKGSAYRREGTKMLIDEAGQQVCMISGGCLEGEIGELAQQVIANGQPLLKFFALDEDVVWGLGLGCGGKVDVYLEPLEDSPLYQRWLARLKAQRFAALATVIDGARQGARLLIDEEGRLGSLGDAALDAQVAAWVAEKQRQLYPRAETRTLQHQGEALEVFVDLSLPPAELVLFGAGHDAIPMAQLGHRLGFAVTVVDARPAYLTPERFPQAQLLRSHPSGFEAKLALGPRSYAIIMNHHLERDAASLAFALQSSAAYIGVLGPKDRYRDILARLAEQGVAPRPEDGARIYNPIGIDIGAETPEEIAVSVMAELLAVRGGYGAGFLRAREGKIHQPAT